MVCIPNTDERTLREYAQRLRFGPRGRDHEPRFAADLIEALLNERTNLTKQVRDLEGRLTKNAPANDYARGYRDALAGATLIAAAEPHIADAIAMLRPNIQDAS